VDIVQRREITVLLKQMGDGRPEAVHELLPLVYEKLRAIAQKQLGRNAHGHTLTPTVLVHEVYFKLFDQKQLAVKDRYHFYSLAARAMRQIVVDYARQRRAQKRGGDAQHLPLEAADAAASDFFETAIDLDEALKHLYDCDERLGQVVELRFFGGLSVDEVADLLGIGASTVKRDWRTARALLFSHLK